MRNLYPSVQTMFAVICLFFIFNPHQSKANNIELCFDDSPSEIINYESTLAFPACNTSPVITCPSNYFGCPGASILPSNTGMATAIPGEIGCPTPTITYEDIEMTTGPCNGQFFIKRKWTASYPNNANPWLIADCTQIILLEDTASPTIANCPASVNVSSSTSCDVAATWTVPTAHDNCGIASFTSSHNSGDVFPDGQTTVTYVATDNCGHSTSCSFVVTVDGTCCISNPIITCPQDVFNCPNTSTEPSATGTATAVAGSNECAAPTVTYNDVILSSGDCGSKTIKRYWTATDPNNPSLTSTCHQIIALADNQHPIISKCPLDIVQNSNSNCEGVATWNAPTSVDNCGIASLTSTHASGSTFPIGTTTVTYTATDNCGNTTTCSFHVTINDNCCDIAPSINCPADYFGCPSESLAPSHTGIATATPGTEACSTPIITHSDVTLTSGPCAGSIKIQRTWTATDPSNSSLHTSCIQIIELKDNVAPVLTACPANITVDEGNTATWIAPTATDNCDATPTVTSNYSSGHVFPIGTTTVTYTATDDCGHTTTCSFTVTVHSGITVTCPANITLNCDGNGAIATWITPTTTQSCGLHSLTSTHNSGSLFPVGTTTVTYTATDNCGHSTTCSFNVTVNNNCCNTPPVIECSYYYIGCVGSTIEPSFTGYPTVTSGSTSCATPVLTYSDEVIVSGPCPGYKKIHRTWVATDPNNSSLNATCMQVVELKDEIPPHIDNCPADMTIDEGVAVQWTLPTINDNCTSSPIIVSNYHPGDILPVGENTVTYTVNDLCGNETTCSFKVTVIPSMSIDCPEDITVQCNGQNGTLVHWNTPTFITDCTGCENGAQITGFLYMGDYQGHSYYCSNGNATWNNASAICAMNGGHLAVINSAGENEFLAQQLTIQSAYIGLSDAATEGVFSWVNGEPITYTNWYTGQPNNYNGDQDYVEMLNDGQWNDQYTASALEFIMELPCSSIVQTAGPTSGSYFPVGTTTISYLATDACGETSTCSFDVTVESNITIDCPADVTLQCPYNANGVNVTWSTPHAESCCSSACSAGGNITGFVYMGSLEGHHYYCSTYNATWPTANAACISHNGQLVTINSQAENNFLANQLMTQSAYIGLNDAAQEGTFTWSSGESFTWANWYPGQPNNFNGNQDYVELMNNGQWNDQYNNKALEFIMEISGCMHVNQTQGPSSGSHFANGTTTTITYLATDECGNSKECSFDITIESQECNSGSNNSNNTWIEHIGFNTIYNTSGNDGGYADYSTMCTTVSPGMNLGVNFVPGFAEGANCPVFWKVWVDWNMDGDFIDSGEYIAYGSSAGAINGNIVAPYNLWAGTTTMRIAMKKGSYPTGPCEAFVEGETEDYCLNITGGDINDEKGQLEYRSIVNPIELFAQTTEKGVRLYPNPSSEFVRLEANGFDQEDIQSVNILNVNGQVAQKINNLQLGSRIELNDLSTGMYLIQTVLNDGTIINEKLMIQK